MLEVLLATSLLAIAPGTVCRPSRKRSLVAAPHADEIDAVNCEAVPDSESAPGPTGPDRETTPALVSAWTGWRSTHRALNPAESLR